MLSHEDTITFFAAVNMEYQSRRQRIPFRETLGLPADRRRGQIRQKLLKYPLKGLLLGRVRPSKQDSGDEPCTTVLGRNRTQSPLGC